jgi:chemotaxis protein MotB
MSAPGGRGGHDRWLVSYADFITLLFAFFTTMSAISTVDADKLAPVASSLQDAFDAAPPPAPAAGPSLVPPVEVVPRRESLARVRADLARDLADAIASGRLDLASDPRGLVVSLPEGATFAVGSADVTPEAGELITRLAATLRPLDNALRIEGHTDDVPIHTPRFRSNWELSTGRAAAVIALLIEREGFDPTRLSAAGYAEFRPRVPNDSPRNRARNRRVDIVVLEEPDAAGEPILEGPQAAGEPAGKSGGA